MHCRFDARHAMPQHDRNARNTLTLPTALVNGLLIALIVRVVIMLLYCARG